MWSSGDYYQTAKYVLGDKIYYFFQSEGKREIIKSVQYAYSQDFLGRKVFNLGFGDYNPKTKSISDSVLTNNGDHYRVLHTVLNTIPDFFITYPDALMMVRGSDSRSWYSILCRLSCKKKCGFEICKNEHRRINLYRNFVDKNYEYLTLDYKFYGGKKSTDNQLNAFDYEKSGNYDFILVQKV